MKQLAGALRGAGVTLGLSSHASDRIRQRVGITSAEVGAAWASDKVRNAIKSWNKNGQIHYDVGDYVIVVGGNTVITVTPKGNETSYLDKFNEVVAKEARKHLDKYRRDLRKADIAVAEAQLNYLRAKNPNTREIIRKRIVEAGDKRAQLNDKIYAVELAAKRYGVETV